MWANDLDTRHHATIQHNLRRALGDCQHIAHEVPALRRQTIELRHRSAVHAANSSSLADASTRSMHDASVDVFADHSTEVRTTAQTNRLLHAWEHASHVQGSEAMPELPADPDAVGSAAHAAIGSDSDSAATAEVAARQSGDAVQSTSESGSDSDQSPANLFYAHADRHHHRRIDATARRARVSHYDGA